MLKLTLFFVALVSLVYSQANGLMVQLSENNSPDSKTQLVPNEQSAKENYFSQRKENESNMPDWMVFVKGGTFKMIDLVDIHGGSSQGKRSTRTVTLSDFYIAKYEVTQEFWESVMGNNPSMFVGSKLPIENITWVDAIQFCNYLSEKEGLTPVYTGSGFNIRCNFKANGYRLPTYAEWEYAARGGQFSKKYKYSGSNEPDKIGWFSDNSNERTHDVGTKLPNELGLYDMNGNVYEWCWDFLGYGTKDQSQNSHSPYRIISGGGWYDDWEYSNLDSGGRLSLFYGIERGVGMRLVRTK